MADLITGNTQLSATKADIITALVQRELKFGAKLLPTVTDLSMFAVKGAKSVSIPRFTSFTVVDRASGAQGDASVLTSSADKLDLDNAAYVAWIIDSQDEVQSSLDGQALFAQRAAAAQARYIDSAIITRLGSVASNTPPDTAISAANILDARAYILGNDGMLEETFMLVGVDQEKVLLGISDFIRADSYGAQPTALSSGVIGKIFGVPVIVHNGVAAGQMFMYSKSGIAIAFQQGPMMSEQGANEYGSQAKRVALDQLFGTQGLQLAEKGAAAGKSALVWKLHT